MTRDELRSLAAVRPEHGRVLSVFLDLDPSQFGTGDAKASALNSALDEAQKRLTADDELDRDARMQLDVEITRVRDALDPQHLAAGGAHGLAVFASEPAGLLEVVPSPRRLPTQVEFAETPVIAPLIVAGEAERVLVVLAGSGESRVFAGTGDHLEEVRDVADHIDTRVADEDRAHHLRQVAEALRQRHASEPFDVLFTAGPEQAGSELAGHLHPDLEARLAGHARLDSGAATPATVAEGVAPLLARRAAEREKDAVDRLAAGLHSPDGHAVAGTGAVRDMLTQRRVETLLLAQGHTDSDAVTAALEQDAAVLVLPPEVPDLQEGIAALLRF